MTGCHKNVCFDDESYCFFLTFLTVGKMVYGTYFLPTDTNSSVNKLVYTCNKFSNSL